MKTPTLLLVGSLVCNAAAIAFYVTVSPAADTKIDRPSSSITSSTRSSKGQDPNDFASTESAQSAQFTQAWSLLQSGDLRTLAASLRAAGLSPSMIRNIIGARVSEQFSARRKALITGQEETPYWQNKRNHFLDPKTMAALRELDKEQNNILKGLLGSDELQNSEEMKAYQHRQYGDLPREKIDQLQSINSDYGELTQEIYMKSNGVFLPEDREKLAILEKEKLADLAKVLTPQELEEYQLRNSNTAGMLRSQLATFNATEDEFRALFRATAAVEAQFGPLGNVRSADDMRKRQEAVLAQVQNTFTQQRLAELKLATDPEYQQINRLVARLDLPPSTSQEVVSLQKDIQQRASAIQSNRNLRSDERIKQLATLSEEATTRLTSTLGTRGLEAYKLNGGYWLQTLKPRPTTRPGPGN